MMGEPYGPYPTLDVFPQDSHSPQMSDESQAVQASQSNSKGIQLRKHAACDECRKRKLKCTGERTGCERCVKNSIPCIYSRQKQMGRPRKRQRTDEKSHSPVQEEARYEYPPPPPPPLQSLAPAEERIDMDTPIDPSLANIDQELTDFHNVCTGPIAQTIRGQRVADVYRGAPSVDVPNVFEANNDAVNFDYSASQYPTDISQWPDFSTIDKLPLPLTTRYNPDPSSDLDYETPSAPSVANTEVVRSYVDPDADPSALAALPAIPACPCLPNLYLSLSTLSTLGSYPVTQETIDTLLSAHKTAHSVIYCPVCPKQYASGSQNLMLGCTLLNVLADTWHRIRSTTPEDLKRGFIPAQQSDQASGTTKSNSPSYFTTKDGQNWRSFARQLIRAYVFGDAPIPKPPSQTSTPTPTPTPTPAQTSATAAAVSPHDAGSTTPTPSTSEARIPKQSTLDFLVSALERRQRQWHDIDAPTDEFPDRGPCWHHANWKTADYQRRAAGRHGSESGTNGRTDQQGNGNGEGFEDGHGHGHEHGPGENGYGKFLCIGIVHQSRNIVRAMAND